MKKTSLLLLFCLKISYTVKKPHETEEKTQDEIRKEIAKTYQRGLALKIKAIMESPEGENNERLQLPIRVVQPQVPAFFSFLNNFPAQNTELDDTQKANEFMKPEKND
jgi:hypothetical protein